MINESTDKRLSNHKKTVKPWKLRPNYRFHCVVFDSVTLRLSTMKMREVTYLVTNVYDKQLNKRQSGREVQDLQMSSVVFYGSKPLKAALRYGNMKLVTCTVRSVQVKGCGTPCR